MKLNFALVLGLLNSKTKDGSVQESDRLKTKVPASRKSRNMRILPDSCSEPKRQAHRVKHAAKQVQPQLAFESTVAMREITEAKDLHQGDVIADFASEYRTIYCKLFLKYGE